MSEQNQTNWSKYELLVMHRLDQQDKQLSEIKDKILAEIKAQQKTTDEKVTAVQTEITSFKSSVKTAGAIYGFLSSILIFIADHLWRR